jgi:hypothetical protein
MVPPWGVRWGIRVFGCGGRFFFQVTDDFLQVNQKWRKRTRDGSLKKESPWYRTFFQSLLHKSGGVVENRLSPAKVGKLDGIGLGAGWGWNFCSMTGGSEWLSDSRADPLELRLWEPCW